MKVQWFPGHMSKTKALLAKLMPEINLVIEVLDARIPMSSKNPIIDKITKDKSKLIILSKADLADKKTSFKWLNYFNSISKKNKTIIISSKEKKTKKKVEAACSLLTGKKKTTALIMGIPNVGKSTIINLLTGEKKVDVGDRPAITRDFRKINILPWLKIIDTPGILWHRFDDEMVGIRLAILGCIKDSILNIEETCIQAVNLITDKYPGIIEERFKIKEDSNDPVDMLNSIAKKRGCLLPGGGVNFERACLIFLFELRSGKIGTISLEEPPE